MEVCGLLFGIKWKGKKSTCLGSCISHPKLPLHRNQTSTIQSLYLCPSICINQLQISMKFNNTQKLHGSSLYCTFLYVCNNIFKQRMIMFLAVLISQLTLLNVSRQKAAKIKSAKKKCFHQDPQSFR